MATDIPPFNPDPRPGSVPEAEVPPFGPGTIPDIPDDERADRSRRSGRRTLPAARARAVPRRASAAGVERFGASLRQRTPSRPPP